MRVSLQALLRRAFFDMEGSQELLFKSHSHVSSGRKLLKPSDDPVGMYISMCLENGIDAETQYIRNIDDGTAWTNFTDGVIDQLTEKLTRAKQLALQGSNDTYTNEERRKIAIEINQILEHVYALSNTRYKEKYIFAGTNTLTQPFSATYDATTGEILTVQVNPTIPSPPGIDGKIYREVGENERVQINITGTELFTGPTVDIFQTLIDLRDALRNDDLTTMKNCIDQLDQGLSQVLNARAKLGGIINRLQLNKSRSEDKKLRLQGNKSELQDADMAQELINLQKAQIAYQAALFATSRVIQYSLVKFVS